MSNSQRLDPSNISVKCQQVLQPDGSVFSVQWLELPEPCAKGVTAPRILDRYLQYLRKITLSMVRPTLAANGVQFRLLGSSLSILSFAPPQLITGDGWEEVRLTLTGGLALQKGGCQGGAFSVIAERTETGVAAKVQLSEFCPTLLGKAPASWLRKQLYKWTQAYVHKLVTVSFLSRLYRDLTGVKARTHVEKVTVRQGTPI
jgi:hypothetical protein